MPFRLRRGWPGRCRRRTTFPVDAVQISSASSRTRSESNRRTAGPAQLPSGRAAANMVLALAAPARHPASSQTAGSARQAVLTVDAARAGRAGRPEGHVAAIVVTAQALVITRSG